MRKEHYCYCVVLLTLLTFFSCKQSSFSRHYFSAEQIVHEMDSLYIQLDGVGNIRSAMIYDVSGNEKIADFHIHFSETPSDLPVGFELESLNNNSKAAKELFMLQIRGLEGNPRVLFDSLASFNYSARFNINADEDTTTAIVLLSPKEIKLALQEPPFKDKHDLALEAFCRTINISLPYDIDEITKWTSVTKDQNFLIFNYKVNDKDFPIKNLDTFQYKQNLLSGYVEDYNKIENILWNTVSTHRGIKYTLYGTSSGETVVVAFDEKKLEEIYHDLYSRYGMRR